MFPIRCSLATLLGCLVACSGKPTEVQVERQPVAKASPAADPVTTPPPEPLADPVPAALPPSVLPAPAEGDVAAIVANRLKEAEGHGRRLVVYVGAEWCKPCVAFREQLLAGTFNHLFPGTTFLEFNTDTDRDRLTKAGYHSRLIPLLALPNTDGTCSTQRIEGAHMGPKMGQKIAYRLSKLLNNSKSLNNDP